MEIREGGRTKGGKEKEGKGGVKEKGEGQGLW
jgi:hypothetical protein